LTSTYSESGILDVEPDEEGCVEVDLGQIVDYIIKEAHKDEMGDYDPEEILFVVQGELEYTESLDDDEVKNDFISSLFMLMLKTL